jgi:alpha-glucosidase
MSRQRCSTTTALVAFRKGYPALAKGSWNFVDSGDGVLSMIRATATKRSSALSTERGGTGDRAWEGALEPLDGHGFSGFLRPDTIEISPYDAFFARLG